MKHRLWIFAAGLALAMAVAIVTVSVITNFGALYFEREVKYFRGADGQVLQTRDQGFWQGSVVCLHWRTISWDLSDQRRIAEFLVTHPSPPQWRFGRAREHLQIARLPHDSIWNQLGLCRLQYTVTFGGTSEDNRVLALPTWPAAVPLIAFALPVLSKCWRYRRRNRLNLCQVCGYDLRATPGRCPECGAITRVPL